MPRQTSNSARGKSKSEPDTVPPSSREAQMRMAAKGPSLKMLAQHLGLAPATVSVVLNNSPVAATIPVSTRERIFAAARALGYRPNFLARSLRAGRSFTIGVLVPEVSEGYAALVLSGIEDYLLTAGYFYFVASHRHRPDLIEEYPRLLLERAVEGFIMVDTPLKTAPRAPAVSVSGHHALPGVTNIRLDHRLAARQALAHLQGLGHSRIAFIKGQPFSSDTQTRWEAIQHAAAELGLEISPDRVVQLSGDFPTPEPGLQATRQLLARQSDFSALFAFNDMSAIGALRALRESRRIPEEVSIVGFDDIESAAFQHPALTTVRQPLRAMGELAARTLLARIQAGKSGDHPRIMTVKPELVIRASTAPCPCPP